MYFPIYKISFFDYEKYIMGWHAAAGATMKRNVTFVWILLIPVFSFFCPHAQKTRTGRESSAVPEAEASSAVDVEVERPGRNAGDVSNRENGICPAYKLHLLRRSGSGGQRNHLPVYGDYQVVVSSDPFPHDISLTDMDEAALELYIGSLSEGSYQIAGCQAAVVGKYPYLLLAYHDEALETDSACTIPLLTDRFIPLLGIGKGDEPVSE